MPGPAGFSLSRLRELFRFYQAAMMNTAFGFGMFALMIWLGVNLYVAQVLAQLMGMTFNYFTYSRHVFRESEGSKVRFVAAYGANYFVNLGFLAIFDRFVNNDYVAGFLATICASLVNYFALKHIVFTAPRAEQ